MKTEWKDCTDPEELFRLKREGCEIEYYTGNGLWSKWGGHTWAFDNTFRVLQPQPKTKTITLRKAYFIQKSNGYDYTLESARDLSKLPHFVCWLGEPYNVEVPE